jgi:hypothetical protein
VARWHGKLVCEEGLRVIARMDSNRVARDVFEAHPEWICRNADGSPITVADKYVTCIGSAYYTEYIPSVMEEIIAHSHPDGFSDNSWAGLPRTSIWPELVPLMVCASRTLGLTGDDPG